MSSRVEKILLAAAGGWDAPSARYRLGPLAATGRWDVSAMSAGSLPTRGRIEQILDRGDPSTVLVLQRVTPTTAEMQQLRHSFGAVVFDIDDAIYAVPPAHGVTPAEAVKRVARLVSRGSTRASRRRRPLIETLRQVDVAVVGNEILGGFVARHAPRVIEIPTTVQPIAEPPSARPSPPVIVWMGLPDNLPHLEIVREPLERLRKEINFKLRIVSSSPWERSPVEYEFVEWSEHASRAALLTSTLGLAPLSDDPWTRGKCALRSIQYGGHALPTVASPVGMTHRVVLDGVTGYLAATPDDWVRHLRALLGSTDLVSRLGTAALSHVTSSYSNKLAVARWFEMIESL